MKRIQSLLDIQEKEFEKVHTSWALVRDVGQHPETLAQKAAETLARGVRLLVPRVHGGGALLSFSLNLPL